MSNVDGRPHALWLRDLSSSVSPPVPPHTPERDQPPYIYSGDALQAGATQRLVDAWCAMDAMRKVARDLCSAGMRP